jgi:hypothetical protein
MEDGSREFGRPYRPTGNTRAGKEYREVLRRSTYFSDCVCGRSQLKTEGCPPGEAKFAPCVF